MYRGAPNGITSYPSFIIYVSVPSLYSNVGRRLGDSNVQIYPNSDIVSPYLDDV